MYLAIDIGGTKTLLALFSNHGLCLKKRKFPTEKSITSFTKSLSENLQSFLPNSSYHHRIKSITVAVPGTVRTEPNSYSFKFGNLNWPNIDLVSPIKNLFNCKIFFVNDANLATLYESSRLSHKSGKSIYLTFSTGIGGGIAKDGKLLKSSDAFEPGHIKYNFNNHLLEWEDIAAASALIKVYNVASLQNLVLNDSILNDLLNRLSIGLIDIINQESPEVLIIGGPLAFLFGKIKKPLLEKLRQKTSTKLPILKKAHHPTESTIYGAYLYSKQNLGE